MSEDRFAQLREAEQEGTAEADDPEEPEEESPTSGDQATSSKEPSQSGRDGDNAKSVGGSEQDEADPARTPAFPFTDDLRKSIYVRDSSWSEFKRAYNMEGIPRLYEYGIDAENATNRELHDAIVRVAKAHPEEVAEKIAQARGVTTPESKDSF